jgi:hypothetical protein
MATTARKPAAKKAAAAAPTLTPPAPTPAPKDRTVHLLIRRDPQDGPVLEIEPFSGEMAARRELDSRPAWRYLGLKPGSVFTVEAVATDG